MRLNAVSVLFGSVIAAAVPSNVKHEAAATQPPVRVGHEKPQAMPAFVSLVSFPAFLLAAEDNATTSTATRLAAEVLSAKFAGTTATADVQIVRPEPLLPNTLAMPVDPKTPLRTAALSQSQSDETANGRDGDQETTLKSHREAKERPVTKRRRTARMRHRSVARRTAAATTSGGLGASISQIVGFVGMQPDRMLTD